MKKIKIIIELILFTIISLIFLKTLTKKNDYNEITQGAYVSSMGIEYSLENNLYTIYFYVLNNFNLGLSQYGTSDAKNLGYITKSSSSSITNAINDIRERSNIRLETSHIKSLIIKDTFFNNNNIYNLIEIIKYNPNFYPNFIVYLTSDEITDIFNVNNFTETSAYYTLLVNNQGINKPKLITFNNLINDILDKNYTSYYPIIKHTKDNLLDYEDSYITLYIDGYAFIKNDNQISFFKYENLNGLKFLNPLKKETLNYNNLSYLVYEYYFKKYIKDDNLYIKITLHGKFLSNKNINSNTETLKEYIKNDIHELKNTMDNYNIDVFNISHISNNSLNYKKTNIIFDINII